MGIFSILFIIFVIQCEWIDFPERISLIQILVNFKEINEFVWLKFTSHNLHENIFKKEDKFQKFGIVC